MLHVILEYNLKIITVTMLLAITVGMTACGGGSDDVPGKVTVRYARWGLPDEIKAERELLKEFELAHPTIHVVVEYASWAEYWNKLQAQMAAGTAPDVMLMGGTYVHDYASRDLLENLTPYVDTDESLDLDAFFAPAVEVFSFNDGLWGLARDCNTLGIYYNKTIFDKYDVEYPQVGWTWDDFLDKAKALTVDDDGDGRKESYGFLAAFESMEVNWGPWVWQNGGRVLDDERSGALLNQPEAVEALKFYTNLVLKENISPSTAQASTFGSNMFLTGKLAMSQEGSWMIRSFSSAETFEWAIAPLPTGKKKIAPVNGLGNSVYSGSKHKDEAWELVRFLSSERYQRLLAKSGTSVPAIKEIAYSDTYLDGEVEGKEYFLPQIENGHVLPFTKNFARIEDTIRAELELVWLGEQTIEDALDVATEKVNTLISKNQKSNNDDAKESNL